MESSKRLLAVDFVLKFTIICNIMDKYLHFILLRVCAFFAAVLELKYVFGFSFEIVNYLKLSHLVWTNCSTKY